MALPPLKFQAVQAAIRDLLKALGEDPDREGIKDTPLRVAKMYDDVLDGNFINEALDEYTSFQEEDYGGQVMVHHVPFYAFCEHHLAPFVGHFGMAYIPNGKFLGLSKLVRIFRLGCKKITIQERITQLAAERLAQASEGHGAICYVAAEHMCMTLRGVKSPGSITTTVAYVGRYEKDAELRQQFLDEASKPR